MDTSNFLATYVEEARELLEDCDTHFCNLRDDPANNAAVVSLHRVAHTLKTSSGLMGFCEARELARAVEAALTPAKKGHVAVAPGLLDVLRDAFALIRTVQREIAVAGVEDAASIRVRTAELVARLQAAASLPTPASRDL